ncbi:hypothetical protein QJQ45_007055 [Haematococcus lacustris]|nr:hypothetical protein QJQ45_007055 [Haematococcus lacustris]
MRGDMMRGQGSGEKEQVVPNGDLPACNRAKPVAIAVREQVVGLLAPAREAHRSATAEVEDSAAHIDIPPVSVLHSTREYKISIRIPRLLRTPTRPPTQLNWRSPSWKDLEALPPIGKEYQQGYKRVNDRLPKVRQRLHRAAEFWRGIDGRARNNA